MATISINIHELDDGARHYAHRLDSVWVEANVKDDGLRLGSDTVDTEFDAVPTGSDFLVHGKLSGTFVTECGRCLGDALVPIETSFSLLFSRSANVKAVTEEDIEAAQELEPLVGDIIELDPYLREHILLEVPMQPLCAQDCKGIPIPEHVRRDREGTFDAAPPFLALQKLIKPES